MGKVAWLTGLSGSGKSTIANRAKELLEGRGCRVLVLDGDEIRSRMNGALGFSPDDIRENNRRIVDLCRRSLGDYDVILVPVIAPFRDSRAHARAALGAAMLEVYVRASLHEVARRDTKGLYAGARSGELQGVIGIAPEVPYEIPAAPDLVLDTEAFDAETCARELVKALVPA